MDTVQELQTYINTATKYAFPAFLATAAVYYLSTAASEAWRNRQRSRRQATEDERRRQAYEARMERTLSEHSSSSEQRSDEEKRQEPSAGDRPNVIRSRLPASTRNRFGANVATFDDTRSRITGPSRSCVIGSGASCCG